MILKKIAIFIVIKVFDLFNIKSWTVGIFVEWHEAKCVEVEGRRKKDGMFFEKGKEVLFCHISTPLAGTISPGEDRIKVLPQIKYYKQMRKNGKNAP